MWIKRALEPHLVNISRDFPVLLVTGPRQAGKTSILKHVFQEANYITLDVPSEAEKAERTPDAFIGNIKTPVIIDEIQYAPSLFRYLKVAIDRNKKVGQFLLTGSQHFLMIEGVSESLAGRCAILNLLSLSYQELEGLANKRKLDLVDVVLTGGYPSLWTDSAHSNETWISSYIVTYLERDVRNILNVTKLRDFERFMRAVAIRSGQILSFSELSRDVGIAVSTVREWISVLEASHQIFLLEPYYQNLGKRLIRSPKIYMLDTGVMCYLLGLKNREQFVSSPVKGHIWETYVIGQIIRSMCNNGIKPSLWYWRTRDGHEVDVVLDKGGKLLIADIKFTENPDKEDTRSLKTFLIQFSDKLSISAEVICRTSNDFPLDHNIQATNLRTTDLIT
ncbi:MAG: ATP-binding protein [Planctomycetes bacterium]|nr:ATP-binding protein [Planctomycetota bacterium]